MTLGGGNARGLTALTVPSRLTILLGGFSRGLALHGVESEPRFGKIAHAYATRVNPPHSTFCPPSCESWSCASRAPAFLVFQVRVNRSTVLRRRGERGVTAYSKVTHLLRREQCP